MKAATDQSAGRMSRAAMFVVVLSISLLPAAVPARAEADKATRYSEIYVMDPSQVRIGSRVPAFRAKGINGNEVDFEAIAQSGRPVILAFWSKYCKACVEKFSALVALQAKYEPLRHVEALGIPLLEQGPKTRGRALDI